MNDVSGRDERVSSTKGALTVVALGASAGGLQPLKAFFAAVQPDSALAYVVITHLPASHESYLDELIGRVSSLPVTQAQSGQRVQAGHVYVSVPGQLLGISEGRYACFSKLVTSLRPCRSTCSLAKRSARSASPTMMASVRATCSGRIASGRSVIRFVERM